MGREARSGITPRTSEWFLCSLKNKAVPTDLIPSSPSPMADVSLLSPRVSSRNVLLDEPFPRSPIPSSNHSYLFTMSVSPSAVMSDSYIPYYDGWSGQRVKLKKGKYLASFEWTNTRTNNEEGRKRSAYKMTFSERRSNPLKGLAGKFTIHSRRDDKSVRSNFQMHVDLNEDGKYTKNERLVKATIEGFRIKDSITKYTAPNFRSARSLSSLSESGYISFEIENRWDTPSIRFDEVLDGTMDNFFNVDFSYWNSNPYPIY